MGKAKIISCFSYYLHGSGVSTIALSIAIMFSQMLDKKTLLINLDSKRSMLEKYMQNDLDITQSIDDIAVYKNKLSENILENYTDIINERLYFIGRGEMHNIDFELLTQILDQASGYFDFILLDLGSDFDHARGEVLRRSDRLVYISKYNDVLWETVGPVINEYIKFNKGDIVFNMFPLEYSVDMQIKKFRRKNNISNDVYCIGYDVETLTWACEKRMLYTFLCKKRETFSKEIYVLAKGILEKLEITEYKNLEGKGLIAKCKKKIC